MALTAAQIEQFDTRGYLVVENAVSPELLARLQTQFAEWVEQSRQHTAAFGTTVNGKPRFDLAAGHSSTHPCLRRINAPVEISDAYQEAMEDSAIPDMIACLVGENLRFHHSKINSKLLGSGTEVKWHQDFAFTPHTNPDLVTALLMVDQVTAENGPLQVIPGSHKTDLHSLWHGGEFTGAVDDATASQCETKAIECTGNAGSVCLMHTRLLHASKPNLSTSPRTLFISVYAAADALACSPNPMPSRFEGKIVKGAEPGTVRCTAFDMEIPQLPATASFFDQQSVKS